MRKKRMIVQFDENFNYVNSYDSTYQAEKQTGINHSLIYKCAKFWSINCDKETWKKMYRDKPRKQTHGYIWRFYSDFENRE